MMFKKYLVLPIDHYLEGQYDETKWEFRAYSQFDSCGIPGCAELVSKEDQDVWVEGGKDVEKA